ncbi:hypothetical protein NLI96_g3210 [Meripilus lineatus]|uniref:Gylcosyl hydrolase 115 C-terminal domain-containing protein n=1 Tax=Meripilus lineatus TaxID=2056292 RepID=A0AAD5V7D5_9APHY|nr:hypothetical protein NLI96_g3210 [Physisporinus lineatus]
MLLYGLWFLLTFGYGVSAIGQNTCTTFKSSAATFPIVSNGKATPILLSVDEWPGVQRAAADFAADIQRVTGLEPSRTNVSSVSSANVKSSQAIIVGTLGKSSLIDQVVNRTGLDVSSIDGQWESFLAKEVSTPLPGVSSAYVIIGADKRGTIFALYDHSEQFGVSPWYWWADVPTTQHSDIFVTSPGCFHGSPTVKYRGIFLNDEQPALQNWAMEKFTNGTGAALTGSPFNHLFYTKLFELILRLKGNYLWPAIWSSAFDIDDPQNQPLADWWGVVMGTSHQEPMMRGTPIEWNLFGSGPWDYTTNSKNIYNYWVAGAERAKPFESIFTLGMRGAGDLPLSETTNIALLEEVVDDQRQILTNVFNGTNISSVPQMWALYKEVQGYYEDGMRVPDDVTLLWSDDNWGNIRRFPLVSERNRSGGAGVYYHFDYGLQMDNGKTWSSVPSLELTRSFVMQSTQISKTYEQMSLAVDRDATRIWIVNVGDLKPYEMDIEFFLTLGWNASIWNPTNLNSFVTNWAQREFDISASEATQVAGLIANLTRFNARRKPELLNSTTYSLINYREADNVLADWKALSDASTALYNKMSSAMKPAFFQLVHHPIIASYTLANMWISAGMNNMRASQARLSTNDLADQVEQLFAQDYDIQTQYHELLNGKWDHMMDQTHVGYYYWQQPMADTMPLVTRVQPKKQALAGVMRITPESTLGTWPGDNPNQCAQGYSCPPPSMSFDSFVPVGNRYIDVSAGGPNPFTWTATSSAPWLKLSTTKGSISPQNPEQRVFVSVDWSQVSGSQTATIRFTAVAAKQPNLVQTVSFTAVHNTVPSDFRGFVEGDGGVSIEAAHASRNTSVSGITWTELPDIGRTVSGVTPWPRGGDEKNFTAGSGPSIEYDFYTFNSIGGKGNIIVNTLVSPSLNAYSTDRPISVAVQVDSQPPQTTQFIPPAVPGNLPDAWDGVDGFVANSIVTVANNFTATPGAHILKVWMTEPTVVVQKIIIDTGGVRPSYLGPPESIVV